MKKFILALSLVAFLSVSAVSCSTDDSALETSADGNTTLDNGDRDLPRPTIRP